MPDPSAQVDALSFEALTPTAFLDRAAAAHGDRLAVVDGDQRWTYAELRDRCRRLAGALAPLADGRPVAVLAPSTHVLLEAHNGVPWAACRWWRSTRACRRPRSRTSSSTAKRPS